MESWVNMHWIGVLDENWLSSFSLYDKWAQGHHWLMGCRDINALVTTPISTLNFPFKVATPNSKGSKPLFIAFNQILVSTYLSFVMT